MGKTLFTCSFVFCLFGAATSCANVATDVELKQMCTHLQDIRDSAKIETDVDACVKDARKKGVSQKQALCRISAVNTQEYWNRCRTGEAR